MSTDKNTMNGVETGRGKIPGAAGVELIQVTTRIAVVSFADGPDAVYKTGIKAVSDRLKRHYQDHHYKIFNVSQKRSDLGRANADAVVELGWPDQLAPPLDRLCYICKQVGMWLSADSANLAVVHCKGGRSRVAMVLSAYMHYALSVDESEENAADQLSIRLCAEKLISLEGQPSHKRYIQYFADLLRGAVRVNQTPLVFNRITFSGGLYSGKKIVMKLYEGMKLVWMHEDISSENGSVLDVSLRGNTDEGVLLRGDILFKCFQRGTQSANPNGSRKRPGEKATPPFHSEDRDHALLFQCQFNTCVLVGGEREKLRFNETELDLITHRKRGKDAKGACIEFTFSSDGSRITRGDEKEAATPALTTEHTPTRSRKSSEPPRGGDWLHRNSYSSFYEGFFHCSDEDEDDSNHLSNHAERSPDESAVTSAIKQNSTGHEHDFPQDSSVVEVQKATGEAEARYSPAMVQPEDCADSCINSNGHQSLVMGAQAARENGVYEDGVGIEAGPGKLPPKRAPQVPPKPKRRRSSAEIVGMIAVGGSYDPEELLRGAYEDSTIGRDHSCLPAGIRPTNAGSVTNSVLPEQSGSGSDSGETTSVATVMNRSITARSATPHVEPDLVGPDRYDPASKCFAYVPAKKLREHYRAPKKPPARRPSLVEPVELDVSPDSPSVTESLRRLKIEVNDLTKCRPEDEKPKWEVEIDQLAGAPPVFLERRGSGSVSRLSSNRQPSPPPLRRMDYLVGSKPRFDQFLPNGIHPGDERAKGEQVQSANIPSGYGSQRQSRPVERRSARAEMDELLDPHYYFSSRERKTHDGSGSGGGGGERMESPPVVLSGASPFVPQGVKRYKSEPSVVLGGSNIVGGVRASRKQNGVGVESRGKPPLTAETKERNWPVAVDEGNGAELARRALQELENGYGQQLAPKSHQRPIFLRKEEPSHQEAYRQRNSRSVDSSPYITREYRKLGNKPSTYRFEDDDTECQETKETADWLLKKMHALKNKGHSRPASRQPHETEQQLLEELKNITAIRPSHGNKEGGAVRRFQSVTPTLRPRGVVPALVEFQDSSVRHHGLENRKPAPSKAIDELRLANRRQQPLNRATSHTLPSQQRSLSATPTSWRPDVSRGLQTSSVIPTPANGVQPRGSRQTGQIVTGKPPTPPPTGRPRSSANNSPALYRRLNSSTPPTPARNPYPTTRAMGLPLTPKAIREYMYRRERDRLGLPLGENASKSTMNHTDSSRHADDGDMEVEEEVEEHNPMRRAHTVGPESTDYPFIETDTLLQQPTPGHSTPTTIPKSILKRHPTPDPSTNNNNNISHLPQQKNTNNVVRETAMANNSLAHARDSPANRTFQYSNNSTAGKNGMAYGERGQFGQLYSRGPPTEPASHYIGANGSSHHPTAAPALDHRPAQPVTSLLYQSATQDELESRADTPAFPVGPRSEDSTPLPYHALLYRGAADEGNRTYPGNAIMTQRSYSPRSLYFGAGGRPLSRRSSMTSIAVIPPITAMQMRIDSETSGVGPHRAPGENFSTSSSSAPEKIISGLTAEGKLIVSGSQLAGVHSQDLIASGLINAEEEGIDTFTANSRNGIARTPPSAGIPLLEQQHDAVDKAPTTLGKETEPTFDEVPSSATKLSNETPKAEPTTVSTSNSSARMQDGSGDEPTTIGGSMQIEGLTPHQSQKPEGSGAKATIEHSVRGDVAVNTSTPSDNITPASLPGERFDNGPNNIAGHSLGGISEEKPSSANKNGNIKEGVGDAHTITIATTTREITVRHLEQQPDLLESSHRGGEENKPSASGDHYTAIATEERRNETEGAKNDELPATPLDHNAERITTITVPKSSRELVENSSEEMRDTEAKASPSSYTGLLTTVSNGGDHANGGRLSPRELTRISHLNVIMESKLEKDGAEVVHHHPIFMKDTSKYWYKPTISREQAISMLKHKPAGTFVVRDSNSFPGAFGLALKVAQPPAGVPAGGDGTELVRHFLIEPSPKGVKLKGCNNEPVFGTLAALIYQHSITPLALPCRLLLPDYDPASSPEHLNSNQALLERGAACNVTYLCSIETESLTGPEALRRATSHVLYLFARGELKAIPVHFKVSTQGITLTDNTRSQFFRRHYPVNSVTYAGIDPESRVFDNNNVSQLPPTYVRQAPIFGFVARYNLNGGPNGGGENGCHVFAELDPDQPASAITRFVTNVMMPQAKVHQPHQFHKNSR